MTESLRVVAAAPLSDAIAELIRERAPVDLLHAPDLLPPMRHAADFEGDPSFHRSPEQQQRFEALLDSAEALYGIPDLDPAALRRTAQRNSSLRWVHTMAAGGGAQVKAARLTADQLQRIAFSTSAGVHGSTLAEFAVLGVLAGAKTLGRLRDLQSERAWPSRWEMRQVAEQKVLVLGLGGIGAAVADKLRALGAEVVGTARTASRAGAVERTVPISALPAVIGEFDAVVSTLPGTAATDKLLSRDLLHRVKRGVTVVNVGRGTVIDEAALVEALRDGRVGFAALDVFEVEPLPSDSPLWGMSNVLISPHTAALSAAEERRIAELFSDNARRLLDGRPLLNRVDTVEFY